jgi:hypothetical protein
LIPGPYNLKAGDSRNGTMRIRISEEITEGKAVIRFTLRSEAEGEEGEVLARAEMELHVERKGTPGDGDGGIDTNLAIGLSVVIILMAVIATLIAWKKARGKRRRAIADDEEDEEEDEIPEDRDISSEE